MKFFLNQLVAFAAAASVASAERAGANEHLQVDVFHLPQKPVQYQNTTQLWSPQTFTLIHSKDEAVLVDAPTVAEDGTALANWIAKTAQGTKLKYIYITHAHADHFNAYPQILAKFPEAKVVTTPGVISHMPEQYAYPTWEKLWQGLYPTLQKADLSLVHPLPPSNNFFIKGSKNKKHEFRAILVGEGDTPDSTVLHVPDVDLVVGGDVVYGHCYQYLVENPTPELRSQWVASLEKIKKLKPKVVVPSHTQDTEGFGPEHLQQTQDYIRGWEGLLKEAKTWQELEQSAKKKWPDRTGSFILRYSSQDPFGATF